MGFEPAIRSHLISTSQLLRWQLGQLFYGDVHLFPYENRFKTDNLKNPVIVIYNQLPYILLKVQIYGEREYLLLTLNRLLRWLNRLSGNHPHPYSQKIGGRGKRNNNGVFLSPFLLLKKTFGDAIIPPGKGHHFIIPTQNERWKKQAFLEHVLLPSSIYWSPKTSTVFILATFPAFYRRTSISIPIL